MENYNSKISVLKIVVPLLFSLVVTNFSIAQTSRLSVEIISTDQGLPDKRVKCITQDNMGFMWVGTLNGFFRYDGYSFEDFTQRITGSKQLKGTAISAVEKDEAGNIWIGHDEGLSIFNPATGSVETKNLLPYKEKNIEITKIYFDQQHRVLLYFSDGTILCFDKNFKHQFTYSFSVMLNGNPFQNPVLFQDADYSFWMPTLGNGIDHISRDGKFIEHYRPVLQPAKENSLIRVVTSKGILYQFHLGERFTTILQHKPLIINENNFLSYWNYAGASGIYSKTGNFWKIQAQHISLFDTELNKKIDFTLQYVKDFPTDHPVLDIYQSSDYSIWTCSRNGLYKINYKRNPFTNFLTLDSSTNLRQGISIRGMMEDKEGNIWIGSYPYLYNNGKTHINLSLLKPKANNAVPVFLKPFDNQVYQTETTPLFRLFEKGEYIIASTGLKYIYTINKKSGVFQTLLVPNENQAPVRAIISRNDSTVFYTTRNTVVYYNPQSTPAISFYDVYKNEKKDLLKGINDFFDAGKGLFWAIGDDGIYLLNNKGVVIKSYTAGDTSPIKLPALDINYLFQQTPGIIWLGTRHGLVKLDTFKKTGRVYTEKDGLPNNNVMSILPDEFDCLWLSTDKGLSRYHTKQNIFINYDINDELPHNEFNRHAYLKASDGRLYFGGLNGVTAVYPNKVDTSLNQLQPYLVSYTNYNGKQNAMLSVSSVSITDNRVVFNHNDKLFNFRFMLPAYRNAGRNRFLYQLEGWDKEWQNGVNTNTISYSFLPPGKYVLKVKGAAAGDSWGRKEYKLQVVVLQAWYRTGWFYSLLGVMIAVVVYTLYRYRINQLMKVQNIRNQISADLHDELGSVLTQISLQSEMVSSNIYREEEKQKELKSIAATSRRAIHTMSDIVWSVKPGQDKTASLIDRMKDHAAMMLQPLKATVDFNIKGISENKEIDNQLRQELFLIFKEAIHNIVKHSSPTHIQIDMKNENRHFELVITNDINQPKENTALGGNGIANMVNRAKRIGATLETKKNENSFRVILKRHAL